MTFQVPWFLILPLGFFLFVGFIVCLAVVIDWATKDDRPGVEWPPPPREYVHDPVQAAKDREYVMNLGTVVERATIASEGIAPVVTHASLLPPIDCRDGHKMEITRTRGVKGASYVTIKCVRCGQEIELPNAAHE